MRTLEILRDSERRWNRRLYHNIGCLVFAGGDDTYVKSSLPLFKEVGLPVEELTSVQAAKRWPQINFKGIRWMVHEKDAGYLTARRNCASVVDGFLQEGGAYRQLEARPGRTNGRSLTAVKLSDNSELAADYFVFALGPWLGKVFPDAIGERIRPTRQQVFFFGTKPGDATFDETKIPCWINHGTPPFYGIPGNEWRGFKIADDSRGPTRSNGWRASHHAGSGEGGPVLPGDAVPRDGRCTAGGIQSVPVREQSRPPLHPRFSSVAVERLVTRRRLGSWLQARGRDRRTRGWRFVGEESAG